MGKKRKRDRRSASLQDRKALRRRLRRVEADLADALARRERLEARVGALSILADEIGATLTALEAETAVDELAAGPAAGREAPSGEAPGDEPGRREEPVPA